MHNKFKQRISRIFHNSCNSRDDVAPFHDVLEKSPFLSPSRLPTRALSRPSACKHMTPPSLNINNSCIISYKEARSSVPPSRKIRPSRLRSKPKPKPKPKPKSPVSRSSHFAYNPFYDRIGSRYSAVKGKAKSQTVSGDREFYSSDDEREDDDSDDGDAEEERTADTLFSSRSLSSSGSSENLRRRTRARNRASRRRAEEEVGGGVKGSMAVVKRSRDPYGDFRKSMAEMIIERQIFGEKELHQLLLCFLSLNSSHHHNIIVNVYKEILDALFFM